MRVWTCQRVQRGERCGTVNPRVKQRCMECGGRRPAPSRPAHMKALDLPYEEWVVLNGGERCAICGAEPKTRRLNRDHCHASGKPRGLLCPRCNKFLHGWMSPGWLRAAADYMERAA